MHPKAAAAAAAAAAAKATAARGGGALDPPALSPPWSHFPPPARAGSAGSAPAAPPSSPGAPSPRPPPPPERLASPRTRLAGLSDAPAPGNGSKGGGEDAAWLRSWEAAAVAPRAGREASLPALGAISVTPMGSGAFVHPRRRAHVRAKPSQQLARGGGLRFL